jgi:hypothetical protein
MIDGEIEYYKGEKGNFTNIIVKEFHFVENKKSA